MFDSVKANFNDIGGKMNKSGTLYINIVAALITAILLYTSGIFVIASGWLSLLPLGWFLSTFAFIGLYRVGISCTSLLEKPSIENPLLRRIVGQLSLLLLLRPIVSLRIPRPTQSEGGRLNWVIYKIRNAYSLQKQVDWLKSHPGFAQRTNVWLVAQWTTLVVFCSLFFPLMIANLGLSGLIRFWLVPFVAMHVLVGSMSCKTSKEDTREQANKIFSAVEIKVCTPRTRKISVKSVHDPVEPFNPPSFTAASTSVAAPPATTETRKIHYFNLVYLSAAHLGALYGAYQCLTASSNLLALAWVFFVLSELGITAGAHRLWAHRAFNASTPVQVFLMFLCCMANEGSVFKWARDHRLHHKHVDTDLDPHDASRGFFYSHMGWLFEQKSDSLRKAGKQLHVEDLVNNKVVMFQHKNYLVLSMLCCFALPTALVRSSGGDAWQAFWIVGMLRYVCVLHGTWLVNSLAHFWGSRPYVSEILPCENLIVSIFAMGEGWHNYHHAYPYDYSANEYGWWQWNPTTLFLDACAAFGGVSNRRRGKVRGQAPDKNRVLPEFTMADVKASVGQAAMLLIVDGYVYDVAEFIDQKMHPGGEKIIKAYIGKDVSQVFRSGSKHKHTAVAYSLLEDYRTGKMVSSKED